MYHLSRAALLWNVAALPLPPHSLDYSGATATVKCSAATLAATMAKIIGYLSLNIYCSAIVIYSKTFNNNTTFSKQINATLFQLT